MKDDFYCEFENSFRGDRSEIKARLHAYFPFLKPLINLYPEAMALDLGCGRGEWLEVLRENGVKAQGIDLDDAMLSQCRQLDLDVTTQDAITALKSFKTESLSIISAFHLIEHISFQELRTLLAEAQRTLKPAGLLILETPNPENILVGTSNFYLDPTHTRPIPPGLLKFLAQHYGFINSTVLGLQESAELYEKSPLSLKDVWGGSSPDYAVVTQKLAPENIIAHFKQAFNHRQGLSTDALISRYDQYAKQERETHTRAISTLSAQMQQEHFALTNAIDALKIESTQKCLENTQAIATLNAQVHAVFESTSWRVTRPIRAVGNTLRRIKKLLLRCR